MGCSVYIGQLSGISGEGGIVVTLGEAGGVEEAEDSAGGQRESGDGEGETGGGDSEGGGGERALGGGLGTTGAGQNIP